MGTAVKFCCLPVPSLIIGAGCGEWHKTNSQCDADASDKEQRCPPLAIPYLCPSHEVGPTCAATLSRPSSAVLSDGCWMGPSSVASTASLPPIALTICLQSQSPSVSVLVPYTSYDGLAKAELPISSCQGVAGSIMNVTCMSTHGRHSNACPHAVAACREQLRKYYFLLEWDEDVRSKDRKRFTW